MIKKLNADDIAKIFKMDDAGIKNSVFKEKGQWMQFLMQNVYNPKVLIAGSFNDKSNLIDYFVCILKEGTAYLIYISDETKSEKYFIETALTWVDNFNLSQIFLGKVNDDKKYDIWAGA